MIQLNIKPLSVNEAWQGKRFKTSKYTAYEKEMLLRMPLFKLPQPPYSIAFEFGFSNKSADIDNPCKPLLDILQKRYKFNDSQVYELKVSKVIVKRGSEYVKFEINSLEN